MRVLMIHAKEFSYRVKSKAISSAEEIGDDLRSLNVENALIIFLTVEKDDCVQPNTLVSMLVKDIINHRGRVKANYIVIYPYAHLSSKLAEPSCALKLLKDIEAQLRELGLPVRRAPFGWYKEFSLTCLGHPLSELSRTYGGGEAISANLKHEVLKYSNCDPPAVINAISKLVKVKRAISVKVAELLSKFNIIDSFIAKEGELIISGLTQISNILTEAIIKPEAITELNTSALTLEVSGNQSVINQYRQIVLGVIRKASKFGLLNDEIVLKLRNISIRYEGIDALTGLEGDFTDALLIPLGRCDELNLMRALLKAASIIWHLTNSLMNSRKLVLVVKSPHTRADEIGKYEELLSIYQVSNYCIFSESTGNEQLPAEALILAELPTLKLILPLSYIAVVSNEHSLSYKLMAAIPLGPIIKTLHAVFYNEVERLNNGIKPVLPPLITPVHAAIIPVSPEFREYAVEIAEQIKAHNIRVAVDLRELGLGRKIRDAGKKWVPYVIVVGKRELITNTINVRDRYTGLQKSMNINEFIDKLERRIKLVT